MAKQATEIGPLVTVPTRLAYDMSNYAEWRRWFHNQAALHDCVTALTCEPSAAPPLEHKLGATESGTSRRYSPPLSTRPCCSSRSTVTLWSSRSKICGAVPCLQMRQLTHCSCRPVPFPRTCRTSPCPCKSTQRSMARSCPRPQSTTRQLRPSNSSASLPALRTYPVCEVRKALVCRGVKGQVRDAERNLRFYFRVAIIRAVSKALTRPQGGFLLHLLRYDIDASSLLSMWVPLSLSAATTTAVTLAVIAQPSIDRIHYPILSVSVYSLIYPARVPTFDPDQPSFFAFGPCRSNLVQTLVVDDVQVRCYHQGR
jgi:hypothetical protein